jgi:hypothetical protein
MKVRLRRSTLAEWTEVNPVLLLGEAGYESDTRLMRVGDGTTAFLSLPHVKAAAESIIAKVTVADQAARYALTLQQVQNGDYVFQTDTSVLYEVTDQTALNGAGGYTALATVTAAAISDSTAAGRALLTAADAAEQRTLIGAVYPTMLFPSGQNIIGDIPTDWGNGTHDTTLIFGNAVTAIGGAVFNYCASLTGTLIIPSTVITVGPSAFGGCAFTELTIPNSVAILGDGAFNSMGYLTRVNCYVTKTIIDSGYGMFESIGSLTLHARASDATWTAGTGLTVGECYNVTVIKDL